MNSRERVLASINHKEPDKVPVDHGSTPSSGISAIAYDRLLKHLRIKDIDNKVYDVVQQVSQPDMPILELFKVDVLDIYASKAFSVFVRIFNVIVRFYDEPKG